MLTNTERDEIKKALEVATPGELEYFGSSLIALFHPDIIGSQEIARTYDESYTPIFAKAPTWLKQQDEMIEQLIAEARAKDAQLERMRIAVEALEEIANTDTSKVFSFRLTDIAVTALQQIQSHVSKE